MHVKCLALVNTHHHLGMVYKAQIIMKTGVAMVQCFWIWQDRFWWQAAIRIHRHVLCTMNMPFPEKTDTLHWPTGLHKNVCRLGVGRNSQVITKVIVWDILLCVCHICQSRRAVPAVQCYSTFVNLMTHIFSVASLMWKQPSSPAPYIEEDCIYKL